jgi:uncharacterized protein DUF3145
VSAHGVLFVHSAPPALCPHIEWAVAGIVGAPVDLPWVGQPAAPGALRAELTWHARPGTAGAIASALAGWNRLRFEVTEDSSPGCDGVRHCYTPDLGLFSAVTSANGDIMVSEDRLRSVMQLVARTQGQPQSNQPQSNQPQSNQPQSSQPQSSQPQSSQPQSSQQGASPSLEDELGRLLGTAWDNELEPFRRAADGAPVRWLNATG